MSYWIDETGKAGIDDVMANKRWIGNREAVPNFGVSSQPHWFKLELQATSDQQTWLLEVSYALIDYLDVYVVSSEGKVLASHKVGMRRPLENRELKHRFNIIPLTGFNEPFFYFYFRVQSFHSIQLPVALWPTQAFITHDELNNLAVGILSGTLCIMLLYNFFLYTTIRDPIYLAYVGAVSSFLLLQFSLKGFGYRYVWHATAQWSSIAVFFSGLCAIFFATTFVLMFLKLKERGFKYYPLVNALRWLALACAIATPWIPSQWVLLILACLALTIVTIGFNAIFTYYRPGDRPVQIFAAGWTVFLIGVLLLLFNKFGLIPVNIWTEQTISFGTVIEMILFSMALGDRINSEKEFALQAKTQQLHSLNKEREAKQRMLRNEEMERTAKEITLKMQKENNLKLEKEVEQRTQELKSTTQKLQDLVKIDPLTGVYNRHYFNESIQKECRRAVREKRMLTLMMIDIDHFKSVNDRFGHLVGDECLRVVSKTIGDVIKAHYGDLYRYGGEEFAVVLPGMQSDMAQGLAEHICLSVSSGNDRIKNGPSSVTVSIGVLSIFPNLEERPETLIEKADAALYRAKEQGRNRVVVANAEEDKRSA